MPSVSVITASYNYEKYIVETIESVINQTFKDWEMIIVDDGSTDNSVNVIKNYCKKDSRIKLFCHENNQNKGLSETIQLALKHVQSPWIIFLESDDTITSDYIQKKLDVIKKFPQIKFIFNDVKLFGNNERIKDMAQYFQKLYSILDKITFPGNVAKYFMKINIVPTFSCVMLKKEIMENVDYNAIDKRCLDLYIYAQLAVKNDFYFLNEKLTNWRMSKNSYINQKHSDIATKYFLKVQIPDVIMGRKKLIHRINFIYKAISYYFKQFRRKIISFRYNSRSHKLVLFGKCVWEKIE